MHKTFHKLAITAILSVGLSSSLMANDDLLAMATNGEVSTQVEATTTEAMKLSDTQMSDVKGGATIYNSYKGAGSTYWNMNTRAVYSPATAKSAIYAAAFGSWYWGRTYPGAPR